jgi:hypothetical protein
LIVDEAGYLELDGADVNFVSQAVNRRDTP